MIKIFDINGDWPLAEYSALEHHLPRVGELISHKGVWEVVRVVHVVGSSEYHIAVKPLGTVG